MASAGRIDIDVSFRPLESSVGQLRSALQSVADDSQFGRSLSKQLAQIEPRLTKLKQQASEGFLDTSSVSAFNAELKQLEKSISSASMSLSQLANVKLDKLKLPKDLDTQYKSSLARQQQAIEGRNLAMRSSGEGVLNYLRSKNLIEQNGTRLLGADKKLITGSTRTINVANNLGSTKANVDNSISNIDSIMRSSTKTMDSSIDWMKTKYSSVVENFEKAFLERVNSDGLGGYEFKGGTKKLARRATFRELMSKTAGGYDRKSMSTPLGAYLQQYGLQDIKSFSDTDKTTGKLGTADILATAIKDAKALSSIDLKSLKPEELIETLKKMQGVAEAFGGKKLGNSFGTRIDSYSIANAQRDVASNELSSMRAIKDELENSGQTFVNTSAINSYNQTIEQCINEQNRLKETALERMAVEQRQAAVEQNLAQMNQQMSAEMAKLNAQQQTGANFDKALSGMQRYVTMAFSFMSGMRTVRNVINNVKTAVKDLDTVITNIAIVTNMNQSDLWSQLSSYTDLAQQYGVTIKGAYEVSQIFYQQGLTSSNVMSMTNETLKMAKIAGLDYSTAANYMTVAVKAFDIEMSNASQVTDVYSALAASCATDVNELATAMSKTASSAASVNATFENTSAILATMIANTRESPENLGSALKSIISRYGSLTSDITATTDENGEELNYNDVDAALKSVGISIKDSTGQFRNFDDVLLELASTWDTLDTLSQRYIATQLAGNR